MFPVHVVEKLGLCAPSIAPWTISLADLPRGLVPSQRILLIGVAQKVYVQVCQKHKHNVNDDNDLYRYHYYTITIIVLCFKILLVMLLS